MPNLENSAILTCTVIVKMSKKEIPYGTFHSILRQANLTEEDFK